MIKEGIEPVFECYAIREKYTKKYLPMRWKSSRGYSHDEPVIEFPRLFKSERSALSALSAWIQGVWENEFYRTGEYGEELVTYSVPTPVEGRKRENMEVVKFVLLEEVKP